MSKKSEAADAGSAGQAAGGEQQQQSAGAAGGAFASYRPIVGEPVQFLPNGAQTEYVPATVTRVLEDGSCDLHVLRPEFNSTDWPLAVKQGKQRGEFRTLRDAYDAQH